MESHVSSAVRAATCCWLISARAMFVARYSAARPAAPTTNRCRWSSDGMPTNSPEPVTAGQPPFYGGIRRTGRRNRCRPRRHRENPPPPRAEQRVATCLDLLVGGAVVGWAVLGSTHGPPAGKAGSLPARK